MSSWLQQVDMSKNFHFRSCLSVHSDVVLNAITAIRTTLPRRCRIILRSQTDLMNLLGLSMIATFGTFIR